MAQSFSGSLPDISDKDLGDMNQLMADKAYRIKLSSNFFRADKTDRVNPEFVLYTLNDYLGHIQNCVASTRKMLPPDMDESAFGNALRQQAPDAFRLMSIVRTMDVKQLSALLSELQKDPAIVTVSRLLPFVRLLFQSLIRVYYLGPENVAKKYRAVYGLVVQYLVPADPEGLRQQVAIAIQEWQYIFDRVFPGLYPLVLRMSSPVMLSMHQLFYANGSRVLAWLGVQPSEVLIASQKEAPVEPVQPPVSAQGESSSEEEDSSALIPTEAQAGLDLLDMLFPEAGWDSLDTLPDMCGYFQPILEFQDAFTQLAPQNPLQQELILVNILESLFQGLRLIKFEPLPVLSIREENEDINTILESWIRYQETIFDKTFSVDLKAYTHQIYTQPDYMKTPYGRKLLSNMYTLIKSMFLPYFDIRIYGTAKLQKDDRLPPLFIRVSRLKRLLSRYKELIDADGSMEKNPEAAIPGILNPWAPYKFDIANSVSRRLDALLASKHVKAKTNALLIEYTLAILNVLDWWINDKDSFAYRNSPEYLYRVIEPGSSVPAFGVKPRTDVEALFLKHLRQRAPYS